jgi:hypothetical protein
VRARPHGIQDCELKTGESQCSITTLVVGMLQHERI